MCDLVFRQRACNETPNIVGTENIQPTAAMEEKAVRQYYINNLVDTLSIEHVHTSRLH